LKFENGKKILENILGIVRGYLGPPENPQRGTPPEYNNPSKPH
jgi:hypothetical protein